MKSVKRVVVVLIIMLLFTSIIFSNNVFAEAAGGFNMMDEINKRATASGKSNDALVKSVTDLSGSVITIARVICSGVAVAMLIVLGMKYMSAAPSEKADIKKHAVVYIVGAVVMFACTAILGIIQKFAATI